MTDRDIVLGIMKVDVAGNDARSLSELTKQASQQFAHVVRRESRLQIKSITFDGPHLAPDKHGYHALDFVQVGINEKTERQLAFLLIITEVEIAAASLSYLLALPSQLTNVAIISTRRLADYGSADIQNQSLMTNRLSTLMLHCFGRLLNLGYHSQKTNYMARIEVPSDLDAMDQFTDQQFDRMATNLPGRPTTASRRATSSRSYFSKHSVTCPASCEAHFGPIPLESRPSCPP